MPEPSVCAGCQGPITDRFMLRVTGGLWHERCVRCSACGHALSRSCFLRDRKLYCRKDYAQLFAVRCAGCQEPLSASELVMHAGPSVFHMHCFTCSICACRLQTGDRCVLRAGRLLCDRDQYHQGPASPASSDSSKSDDEEDEEEKDCGRSRSSRSEELDCKRPKRPRTILTTQQRRTFKASFEVSSKPCRKVRETLAAETGLSVRVVQVWFQNQRAKMKKLARRQQQQQEQEQQSQEQHEQTKQHTAPSCGGAGELEQLASSCSHLQQQQMGLTSLEQPDFDMDPFRQGLTPPQMPGDHMHPYGFKGLYGDMDCDPLCHMTDSSCLTLSGSSLLTPIDRLYSMQTSYFTS